MGERGEAGEAVLHGACGGGTGEHPRELAVQELVAGADIGRLGCRGAALSVAETSTDSIIGPNIWPSGGVSGRDGALGRGATHAAGEGLKAPAWSEAYRQFQLPP